MAEPDDTHPAIAERILEGYRRMSPAEKLARVDALWRSGRQLALAGIRARHGVTGEREERLRIAALELDRDTMVRVFGWDPAEHGY